MARKLDTNLKAQDLAKVPGLQQIHGPVSIEAESIASSSNPASKSLVFAASNEEFKLAVQAAASLIIISKNVVLSELKSEVAVFQCQNISQAMADVLKLVDAKKNRVELGIAKSAKIHSTAQIGKNANIGEFVVVGANVVIGDDCTLSHHVVVERGAQLGPQCFIHSSVVIGAECILGSRVEIQSNSTIGSDGFGLVTQKDKTHQKIPQIGIVVLEDDVEIGANCAIDRATIDETRICRGTKFDNFVHIAHNCRIGPDSRIAAGFFLAGSSRIGANFLTGGSSVVSDHVSITDDVTLGGKSVVTKDITAPGIYAGYPLEPLKAAMKSIANIANITNLRRQMAEIRKHLGLKE